MMPQNLFETALADVLGQFARALVLSILLLAAAYAVVSGMVKRQLTHTEERPRTMNRVPKRRPNA